MMSREEINKLVAESGKEDRARQKKIDDRIAGEAAKIKQREEHEARERQEAQDAVRQERKDKADEELRAVAKQRLNEPTMSDDEFEAVYPKLKEQIRLENAQNAAAELKKRVYRSIKQW